MTFTFDTGRKAPPLRMRQVLTVLLPFLFSPLSMSQTQTQWQGDVDSVWTNSLNWSNGVPDGTKDVIISKESPTFYDPYVPVPSGGDTARTEKLTIQQGGTLRFMPGGVLIVEGDQVSLNQGTIRLGEGHLIFRGTTTFQSGGIFIAGGGTIEFEGTSWESKQGSTFDPGTCTVILDGSGDQTFTVAAGATFALYNLEVNTEGTVEVNGTLEVTNNCTIASSATVDVPTGSTFSVEGEVTNEGTVTGGGTITGESLPVELVSFSARVQSGRVSLGWTTATETDNAGWEIERSSRQSIVDSRQTATKIWEKIAFVEGSGTSTSPRSYSFTDSPPTFGRIEYRLIQIDRDGTTSISQGVVVDLKTDASGSASVDAYPNPFNPSTIVRFTLDRTAPVSLTVHSLTGQHVATLFDGIAEIGRQYELAFGPRSSASGSYFLRLTTPHQTVTRRLLLVR